jgi:hypothetical protein
LSVGQNPEDCIVEEISETTSRNTK